MPAPETIHRILILAVKLRVASHAQRHDMAVLVAVPLAWGADRVAG